MNACLALRPRWCPLCFAISLPGLLPSVPLHAVGFCSPHPGKLILSVHNYTYFGAQSRGLHPCYTRLRASLAGLTRGFATELPAKALIRWDLSFLSLTHWVALTYFIDLYLIPRFQIYLGTSSALLADLCLELLFLCSPISSQCSSVNAPSNEYRW